MYFNCHISLIVTDLTCLQYIPIKDPDKQNTNDKILYTTTKWHFCRFLTVTSILTDILKCCYATNNESKLSKLTGWFARAPLPLMVVGCWWNFLSNALPILWELAPAYGAPEMHTTYNSYSRITAKVVLYRYLCTFISNVTMKEF